MRHHDCQVAAQPLRDVDPTTLCVVWHAFKVFTLSKALETLHAMEKLLFATVRAAVSGWKARTLVLVQTGGGKQGECLAWAWQDISHVFKSGQLVGSSKVMLCFWAAQSPTCQMQFCSPRSFALTFWTPVTPAAPHVKNATERFSGMVMQHSAAA